MHILYIIIPCYNEEQVLPITSQRFLAQLNEMIAKKKISHESRIMFVNDGSKDQTWEIIKQLSKQDEHFIGISQSRNRGHQNAVLAGGMETKDSVSRVTITGSGNSENKLLTDEERKTGGSDINGKSRYIFSGNPLHSAEKRN